MRRLLTGGHGRARLGAEMNRQLALATLGRLGSSPASFDLGPIPPPVHPRNVERLGRLEGRAKIVVEKQLLTNYTADSLAPTVERRRIDLRIDIARHNYTACKASSTMRDAVAVGEARLIERQYRTAKVKRYVIHSTCGNDEPGMPSAELGSRLVHSRPFAW